jgi:hypothetical protein
MKLVTKLALATTGVVLGLATLDIKEASAVLRTYDFNVVSPTLTGSGRFTFDDTTFNSETIPTAPIQSLTFSFDGQSFVYNETNDVDFPDFPVAFPTTFLTGTNTIGLDFLFNDSNPLSDLSYEIIGDSFTAFSRTDENATPVFGTVSYTRVPEPATLAASFVACSAALFLKRKGISAKKVGV